MVNDSSHADVAKPVYPVTGSVLGHTADIIIPSEVLTELP